MWVAIPDVVDSVKKEGVSFQLVKARSPGSCLYKVIRIVSRSKVSEKAMVDEISMLKYLNNDSRWYVSFLYALFPAWIYFFLSDRY